MIFSNLWWVGEVARGLSLFGGASSEVRRCNCSVVVLMRASFLPEIYLSIYLSRFPQHAFRGMLRPAARADASSLCAGSHPGAPVAKARGEG